MKTNRTPTDDPGAAAFFTPARAWNRRLVLALALLGTAGCDRKETATPSVQFPGFVQSSPEGLAAELFLNPDSARRYPDGWIHFAFIKLLPGGYALQMATTNCQDDLRAADGLKFRDDGTLAGKYPADSHPANLNPGSPFGPLVTLGCRKADEHRTLQGPFENTRALEILFGPFRPDLQAAVWDNIQPPLTLPGVDALRGRSGVVRILVSRDFTEGDVTRHIIITGTKPLDNSMDCRSCGPLLSAAIFVRQDQIWRLESQYPYLAQLGLNGDAPELSWQRIGKGRHAVVAKLNDRSQGLMSAFIGVFELARDGWKPILQFSEQGDARLTPLELDISFGEPTKDYADATIGITGRPGPGVPDRKEVFRFRDGRYVSLDEYFNPIVVSDRLGKVQPSPRTEPADAQTLTAAWKNKKAEMARRAILDYAEAVRSRNLPLALAYWKRPTEKVIRTIQNTEYLAIRVNEVDEVDQESPEVNVQVDMEGKAKAEPSKVWRGEVGMELEESGDWRIVSMSRLKCVLGCDADKKNKEPTDDGAKIKAVLREYYAAIDRHDTDVARQLRKSPPPQLNDEIKRKEFAKVTRMEEPIIQGDTATMWVNVALKDVGRGTETLQGTVQVEKQTGGHWVISSLTGLFKK